MNRFLITALAFFGYLLLMPLLGEPPLRFGYYLQVEGMIASFWLVGGLAGLWTLWLCHQKPRLAQKIWAMPVVWGWLPIIALSAFVSLFAPIPLQGWTGFGQLGEGILTFISQMFLMFVLCVLVKIPRLQPFLLWGTFGSGVLICVLTIIGCSESPFPSMRYWPWAPIFFPDFIAYIAAAFAGLYLFFFKKYRTNYFFHIVFVSAITLISYYSSNKSIGYAMVIAVGIMAVLEIKIFENWRYQHKFALIFVSTILSLTFFIICYDVFSPYLPKPLANLATITGRTYLTKMTFINLLHQPFDWKSFITILFGKGWGEYGNSLLGNVFLLKDVQLFNGENWQPTWEFTDRDLLHSHNTLTEHFLSMGLIGLSIYLWVKYKIALSMKWQNRYAGIALMTVTGVISVFWFPIIHTFPYIMIAHAFVFSKSRPLPILSLKRFKIFTAIIAPLMIIFTIIHTTFIMIQGKHAYLDLEGDWVEKIELFSESPANRYDALIGGRRWIAFVRSYTQNIYTFLEKEKKAEIEIFAEKARKMARDLYINIPHAGNFYSILLPLNIYGELASKPRTKDWFEADPMILNEWNEMAQSFIKHLPFRSDILVPYLNYLMFHHHAEQANEIIAQIFEKSPRDPVGLWFQGTLTLMNGGDRNQGICLLKEAIQEKITRYLPIPAEEVNRIKETFVMCPSVSLGGAQ